MERCDLYAPLCTIDLVSTLMCSVWKLKFGECLASTIEFWRFFRKLKLFNECLVWLQPDRVMEFCNNNDLQLIVRAHECVMDGFERFAQGHLITLFSATNYCGMCANYTSFTSYLLYL